MIGILMLNTQFPRVIGDIGNPETFDRQALYYQVDQAVVDNIVSDQALPDSLVDQFVKGAKKLEKQGATVLGTSCGFLASSQSRIQAHIDIPIITSSLVLIPTLRTFFGTKTGIGVLTFDADKLGPSHIDTKPNTDTSSSVSASSIVTPAINIGGLPKDGELYQCIKKNRLTLDLDLAWQDVHNTAKLLIDTHPETTLLLIECTNISPYKDQLRAAFGLPVFDLVDALKWVKQSSLS
ncbi:MAG: hypothetical protein GKR96_05035 [Gammaproteobacteria bacterium]|nr:hypothetical protein [Gammaproteobacteria bacterium]